MSLRQGEWAVVALFATYALLYWGHVIELDLPVAAQFSYFAGSCSMICMTLGMLLSARPRTVETLFGGLDRMYRLHKHLGVAALILFLAHFVTVPGEAEAVVTAEEEGLPIDLLGGIAMIGSTLLIVITLNRKIPYHRWLATHRFMGLFFAVAGIHVFLALYSGETIPLFSPTGVFLAMDGVGLAECSLKVVHPSEESSLHRAGNRSGATRWSGPKDGMFPFEPGQFAFVTIDGTGFREAHPFTISSGAHENRLRFTMKVLGDYTRRVRDALRAGADADIEGPYGRFNPLRGSEKQVWVAGGIGITPFLSVLRTMSPGHGRTVRLYYCVRVAAEALFFDELEARAAALGGVTVARFDSATGARIDASAIRNDLGGGLAGWSYYLCGPKPMVNAVSEGLKTHGVPPRRIHNEEFELR